MSGLLNSLLLAQVTPANSAVDAVKGTESGWVLMAITAAVVILPFLLGSFIARALRIKEYSTRVGFVLFFAALSVTPFLYHGIRAAAGVPGESWAKAITVGIDLAGGTNLVYQVDTAAAKADGKPIDANAMEQLVKGINKRLNPSGAEELTIRPVGKDRIEVIIPGADKDAVEQKKKTITRLGSLELGVLANSHDHSVLIQQANAIDVGKDDVRDDKNKLLGIWRAVAPNKDVQSDGTDGIQSRTVERRDANGQLQQVRQILVSSEDPQITGKSLSSSSPTLDENGMPAVRFQMTSSGTSALATLTSRYQPPRDKSFYRKLAIILDGKIESAPRLNEPITGGTGIISGQFTSVEVEELVNVLNAGALDIPLIQTPVSEFTISPLLGADVQRKGVLSIVISAAAVFIFMAVYYLRAGLIADLCLVYNLILVVGAMAFIDATFTLPGLAGLVLTIGMAVDANVLIYERMREEKERGASLRMVIHNGFDKALSAIIDSNVTTLITAVILFMIGTDQIKGFAVTLFIGLLASMFAVLVFGHLIFLAGERNRWLGNLGMMPMLKISGIDFLGMRVPAFAISILVIGLSLGALFVRGKDNLDIDFTGGTMVTFEFVKPQQLDDVRSRLEETFQSGITVEELKLAEAGSDTKTDRYRMRTGIIDTKQVRDLINKAFSDPEHALVRVTMDLGPVAVSTTDSVKGIRARAGINPDVFIGGQEQRISFSGPIAEQTVAEYIIEKLAQIPSGKDANAKKFDAPSGLVIVDGNVAPDQKVDANTKFKELVVRAVPQVTPEEFANAVKEVQAQFAAEPVFDELNTFDTSVANETQLMAFIAVILSLIAIVIYIWFRFEKLYFGFAAVSALAHDALVVLGSIAVGAYLSRTPIGPILGLEDFKINMAFIAAILTIIGYSLNDTIVIFDRIREIRGKNPKITYDMINLSVNQTMSRTILTALTVFIVVVILYAFGGEGIHTFAYSFIIGTITGTYSTVFIANPILLWLVNRDSKMAATSAPKGVPTAKPAV